jgi:hypothetical protein
MQMQPLNARLPETLFLLRSPVRHRSVLLNFLAPFDKIRALEELEHFVDQSERTLARCFKEVDRKMRLT